jgi:hypothetical protein
MLEIYLGFHFQAAKRNDETPYGLGHDIYGHHGDCWNLRHELYMPELEWRYGYFTILALMTVISLRLYFYFKKKVIYDKRGLWWLTSVPGQSIR